MVAYVIFFFCSDALSKFEDYVEAASLAEATGIAQGKLAGPAFTVRNVDGSRGAKVSPDQVKRITVMPVTSA